MFCAVIMTWTGVLLWKYDNSENLEVVFFDVGQGDGVFIQTPDHRQILIDGGPNAQVLEELAKVMPWWDRSIDLVVLTHPDSDHVNGLIEVLRRYKVGKTIDNISESANAPNAKLWKREIEKNNIHSANAKSGDTIYMDHGISYDIIYAKKSDKVNESSIVSGLSYGKSRFLFTGDIAEKEEREIMDNYCVQRSECEKLQTDVLKVSHHGSRTATSAGFLRVAAAQYAVIQVGENSFGHPDVSTIKRLEEMSIKIIRTDQAGQIRFRSNGNNLIMN